MMSTTPSQMSGSDRETIIYDVLESMEKRFPSAGLGDGKWYLVAVATLSGSPFPQLVAYVYKYLIRKPEYQTPDSRKALVRRIREALVMNVCIVGEPKPLESLRALDAAEDPIDKDYSSSRGNRQLGPENRARGLAWLDQIYKQDLERTFEVFAAHKDFEWISTEITYGLFLSDHHILDGVETELIVLSSLMIQNLKNPTAGHLRAIRRLGVSAEDVELVQQCVELVAEFVGLRLDNLLRVKDVEHEV